MKKYTGIMKKIDLQKIRGTKKYPIKGSNDYNNIQVTFLIRIYNNELYFICIMVSKIFVFWYQLFYNIKKKFPAIFPAISFWKLRQIYR